MAMLPCRAAITTFASQSRHAPGDSLFRTLHPTPAAKGEIRPSFVRAPHPERRYSKPWEGFWRSACELGAVFEGAFAAVGLLSSAISWIIAH